MVVRLIIKSDASGTGSFIDNGIVVPVVSGSVSGTAKLDRYLTGYTGSNDQKYHFLSSPVTAQPIQGSANFIDVTTNSDDFYRFNEPTATWINARASGNVWNGAFGETNFVPGRGYLVSYSGDQTKNFYRTLNTSTQALTCTYTLPFPAGAGAMAGTWSEILILSHRLGPCCCKPPWRYYRSCIVLL